jgi:hypothetical protein
MRPFNTERPEEGDSQKPELPKPREVDHLIDTLRQQTAGGESTMYGVMGHYCSDIEEARDRARRWSD